jgi:TolB protein
LPVASRESRRVFAAESITDQEGLNESPSWAPNGRHLAFTSTRTGEAQIFTVNRDGSNVRQLTFEGSHTMPNWGPSPR